MGIVKEIVLLFFCMILPQTATQQRSYTPLQRKFVQTTQPASNERLKTFRNVTKQLETVTIQVLEEDLSKTELFDCSQYLKFDSTHDNILKIWTKKCDGYFRLDNNDGKLYLIKQIDREYVCSSSLTSDCKISLTLSCKSALESYDIPLIINVLDINDHAPHFKEQLMTLNISESTQPGEFFHIEPANDADGGNNSLITYTLHPSKSIFQLKFLEDSFGNIVDLRLELLLALDREQIDNYKFRIVATDNGVPQKSSTLNIDVNVLDENDNQPVFERSSYYFEMKSDDPVGHLVAKIKAVDLDEGNNGKIKYSFNKKTQGIYGELFSINSDSGDITLISKLSDHPSVTSPFSLIVSATDSGSNQFPVMVPVKVKVLNTNAHSPVISLVSNYLGSDNSNLIVEENNAENFHVADVVVQDEDHGADGMVDCEMKNNNVLSLFRTNDNEFQLIIKGKLDREQEGRHTATIWCEDMGDEPKSSMLQVNVIVTDLDDNPPVFSKQKYVVSLHENNLVNKEIVQLQIIDADIDPANHNVNFYVEPHFEHLFSVDNKGTLSALISFDREINEHYSFHVFAKGGKISKENSSVIYKHVTKTLIDLYILDLDDEIAKFDQPWYKFNISENQPAGTFVGQVKAHDVDQPPHNLIEYSLYPIKKIIPNSMKNLNDQHILPPNLYTNQFQQRNSNLPFYVDSTNGNILTNKLLDREECSHYEFKVYVKEESANIFVDVLDVNDNPPSWIFPTADNCLRPEELKLKGNLTFARQLTSLIATDRDLNKNAEITYSIISGNDFNQFSVDAVTGVLSWNSYLFGPLASNQCQTKLKFKAQNADQSNSNFEIACLDVIFEDCLLHQMQVEKQESAKLAANTNENSKSFFLDNYLLILIIVSVSCIIITIVLTTAICITRKQNRAMKKERFSQNEDLRASMPLAGADGEAVLVLDRSSTNESTDQLTGILVSLKRAEQLGGRLQLRSLGPSRDSLTSASVILCREKDADSGYADVSSPV